MENSHGKATRPLVKLSSWSESERTFSRTLRGQLWGTIANCLRWESISPMWTMGKSREGGKGGRAQHGETLGRRTARDGDLERHGSTTRGYPPYSVFGCMLKSQGQKAIDTKRQLLFRSGNVLGWTLVCADKVARPPILRSIPLPITICLDRSHRH